MQLTVGQVRRYVEIVGAEFWDIAGPTLPHCGELVTRKTSPGAAADDRNGDQSA